MGCFCMAISQIADRVADVTFSVLGKERTSSQRSVHRRRSPFHGRFLFSLKAGSEHPNFLAPLLYRHVFFATVWIPPPPTAVYFWGLVTCGWTVFRSQTEARVIAMETQLRHIAESSKRRNSPPKRPTMKKAPTVKVRTSHACDRCRVMRTKCSGGDRCTKCLKDNAICIYGDRKRERNKKCPSQSRLPPSLLTCSRDLAESLDRIDMLEEENNRLLNALRTLSERPDFVPEENDEIMEILAKVLTHNPGTLPRYSFCSQGCKYPETEEDEPSAVSTSPSQTRSGASTTQPTSTSRAEAQGGPLTGENKAPSSVGSPGKQGELPHIVSLSNGGGAAGFVGKMSEISWISRAFETVRGARDDKPGRFVHAAKVDQNLFNITDFIYYMDDGDVLAIDEDYVDQYVWPPTQTVVLLSEAFFHAMQGAYHFVLREQFLQQAYQFTAKQQTPSWNRRRWLALANLVWAIGSKWLQITKLNEPTVAEDHLVYYARARALGLDHRVMHDHPDIERIQGIGLLSFYLLVNGSITRFVKIPTRCPSANRLN